MIGLEHFKEHFKDYKNQYVIIGGTAASINLHNAGVSFRSTKDLDVVIIIEALKKEFVDSFGEYIKKGEYEHKKKNSLNQFYRFSKPKKLDEGFPFMIELLSRKPNILKEVENIGHITRLSIEEETVSLSAILLDDAYYNLITDNIIDDHGVSIINDICLIPLKAKAYLDLSERKARGESVKSSDIKKHKNDVFRLTQILDIELIVDVNEEIKKDLLEFINIMEREYVDLKALKIQGIKQDYIDLLKKVYIL